MESAKEFGKTQAWVNFRLSLVTSLIPEVQEKVITRVINPTHAREVAQMPKELQTVIADKVVQQELSTRQTEQLVKVLKDDPIPADLKQKVLDAPKIDPVVAKEAVKVADPETRDVERFPNWSRERR